MYSQIDSNKRKTTILITVFIAIILFIGWIFSDVLGYGYGAMIIAFVISILMTLTSYYKGDKIALRSAGAKGIVKDDNPYVYRMVENIAIIAGIQTPKVYIIDSSAMNAFATGRDPEHASIALTTGIIEALENQELEGVIAHEISHIKNYDIRIMTVVIVLVGMIALLSDMFFRMRLFGGNRDNKNSNGWIALIGIALMILSPIIANIIKLAISRKREYLADASGALLTRYPEGLASALEKISKSHVPFEKASTATAHLFISNPFQKKSFTKLFSTHPPIEDRVNKLRGMIR